MQFRIMRPFLYKTVSFPEDLVDIECILDKTWGRDGDPFPDSNRNINNCLRSNIDQFKVRGRFF